MIHGENKVKSFTDPQFMLTSNAHAQNMMIKLRDIAWQVAQPVKLKSGDLLIIDNKKTSHARNKFSAYFNGNDRWIQRVFSISNKKHINERLQVNNNVYELMAEF